MTASERFLSAFRGVFSGILRWPQLDELWDKVRSDPSGGWYVYHIGDEPPEQPATSSQLGRFLEEVDRLLRTDHDEDYCGIVYADDREKPAFVKIYDPHNLGVTCGYSDNPPLPGWTLSKLKPVDLPSAQRPTRQRRRWWEKLFS
jgi:hypothetical protein